MPIPLAPSAWDHHAAVAHVQRNARERRIRELLAAADWRAGSPIRLAVQRMALPEREELICLLEADAAADTC